MAPPPAPAERGAHLLVDHLRLALQPVASAVEPDLGQNQGTIIGEIVQACHVGGKTLGRLEVHVEADEIREGELQVLGRRIIHVCHERCGIGLPDRLGQSSEETLDAIASVPAHDGRGNLVAHGVRKQRGMPGHGAHRVANAGADRPHAARIVEERDVLLPGEAGHHQQAVSRRRVQDPGRRHGVGSDGIEAVCCHGVEVPLYLGPFGVELAGRAGTERPISGAADQKCLTVDA
jgi:hypothetical protein